MFHKLPPNPNLEHLKKQAKDRLQEMQQANPAAKLADAQFAVAREYGFASWPKLKEHVDLLSTTADSEATGSAEKPNLFIGKWRANLAKSKLHPSNPFQSAIIQFAVDGDSVTIIDIVVDESGGETRTKNTILADGHEHLSENGFALKANWRGSRVLETSATKDGQTVGWGRYEVSDDRRTLTITGDQQMIVLDREN